MVAMASNAPYYQPIAVADQQQVVNSDFDLNGHMLDYNAGASQPSMYPDPSHTNDDYLHHQQHAPTDPAEHAQLHDLVEAATSAAAHEQARRQGQDAAFQYQIESELRMLENRNGKRKHSSAADEEPSQVASSDRPKRAKHSSTQANLVQGVDSARNTVPGQSYSPDSAHLIDARAVGVHSAAALFRPPSDLSKKYTRPPMSKLFTSLDLTPENFLYLQSAAKKYMLDSEYPERQACVGNRGKGDGGEVRLKLNHCVWDFLEQGNGDKFFHIDAPTATSPVGQMPTTEQQRRFAWPREKEKIVTLCTPLLRRMVTNERQRQYAVESRGKGGKDELTLQPNGKDLVSQDTTDTPYGSKTNHGSLIQMYLLDPDTKQIIGDRLELPYNDDMTWTSINNIICSRCLDIRRDDADANGYSVHVLKSGGLAEVDGDDEFRNAIDDVQQTVWLDGPIKIVVYCPRVYVDEED